MKRALLAAALCAVLAASAFAQAPPAPRPVPPQTAFANLQATRAYYNSLIGGPAPNIAGLTLFMTMLPKGGDLHHHYHGAIYAETMLDWMKEKGLCVWRIDNVQRPAVRFGVDLKPDTIPADAKADCVDADGVRDVANNGFYRELLSTWSDKDFANHSHQQTAPDQHFFDTFPYIGAIASSNYGKGLRELKARAIAENVQYIETMMNRTRPPTENADLAAAVNGLAPDVSDEALQAALGPLFDFLSVDPDTQKAIGQYQSELEAAAEGIDDNDFKMRFQTYALRFERPATVFTELYVGFAEANAGGRVVGVNIVAPENWHVSMRDYSLHMRMFAFLKKKFPKVNLSLHAGELALGMVPPEGLQSHIREAVEVAGAQRIGHGVDIAHERDAPDLLRLMRDRKVAVEINLTSNEFILGIKNEAHPILLYRHAGVPFVISTDDPGVSRNNLSGEYVLYATRYRPGYDALKETVMNSIRFSFLSDAEKTAELAKLAQRFVAFEAKMKDLAALPGQGR